jgi:hypothetical protein
MSQQDFDQLRTASFARSELKMTFADEEAIVIRASPTTTRVERERRCEATAFIGKHDHRNYQVLKVPPPLNPDPTSEIHKSHHPTHFHPNPSLHPLLSP